jgi:hypothetical protein
VVKDDRWLEIEDDFNGASQHFRLAVQLFRRGGFAKEGIDGYAAGMAFMHSMQAGHTSLENGLKRILVLLNEDLPIGESWHSDLIKRASKKTLKRPAILSKTTSDFADETRRFRNVAAESLSVSLLPELTTFQALVDG